MKIKFNSRFVVFSLVFFIVALLALVSSILLYSYSRPLTSQTYYAEVNFTDNRAGFDTNRSALIFGNVPLAGSATRLVTITNSYDFSICAKFSARGEIARFTLLPYPETLSDGESKTFSVSVSGSEEASYGRYSGEVVAKLYRGC